MATKQNKQEKLVTLRPFEKEDSEKYLKWVNDIEIEGLLDRVLPVTKLEHEKWYSSLVFNRNAVVFSMEVESEHPYHPKYIGNVWLYDINWRHRKAEMRILIGDKGYWGKGYGVDALTQMVRFAFDEINLHRVYAYILSNNPRSKKAFEKTGFIEEGMLIADRFINGGYQDVYVLGITK